MKKTLCFVLCLFIATKVLLAQNDIPLHGIAVELNSKYNTGTRRFVESVSIKAPKATPTQSDANGKFKVIFSDLPLGGEVHLQAEKAGMELVNEPDLEKVVIVTRTPDKPLHVVMCKAGTLAENKMRYYNIATEYAEAKYKERLAILNKDNAESKALIQQLEKELNLEIRGKNEAMAQLEKQALAEKQRAEELAKRYVRLNLDDVDTLYQAAFRLFEQKKIDQALKLMEKADLLHRADLIIGEDHRIADRQKELDEAKQSNQQNKTETIQLLSLAAELYTLDYQYEQATNCYDKLLQLDSTRIDILRAAAEFYHSRNLYDKALPLYPNIIQHPQAETWQKANAYGNAGELYQAIGKFTQADTCYVQLANHYTQLFAKDTSNTFYKANLATSYSKLGDLHQAQGNYDKALLFFEK